MCLFWVAQICRGRLEALLNCTNYTQLHPRRNLDPAFLRRFERKLLLGLPEPNVRREIIIELMPQSIGWSDSDWSHLLAATDDFSGDDIRIAHKAAALNTVRQTIARKIDNQYNKSIGYSNQHFAYSR